MNNYFSTRELATITISLIVLIYILLKLKNNDMKDILASFINFVKTTLHYKIIIPLILLFFYIWFELYFVNKLGIWDGSSKKEIILWVFSAVILFYKEIFNMASNKYTLPTKIKSLFTITTIATLIMEFLIGAYTFNYWIELILVIIATFITLIITITNSQKQYKDVNTQAKWIMAVIGLFFIYNVGNNIIHDYKLIFTIANLKILVLPAILTFLFGFYIYIFGLVLVYEEMFRRINMHMKEYGIHTYSKIKVIMNLHVNLKNLIEFSSKTGIKFLHIRTKEEFDFLIQNYKAMKTPEEEFEKLKRETF